MFSAMSTIANVSVSGRHLSGTSSLTRCSRERHRTILSTPIVLHIHRLSGSFRKLRTIGGISFSLRRNRIVSVVNPGNSKGSAAVGLVSNFLRPSSKLVSLTSRPITNLDPTSVSRQKLLHAFRGNHIFNNLAIRRGVGLKCRQQLITTHPFGDLRECPVTQ